MEVQLSNLTPWKIFFPFLPWNSCLQRQLCLEKSVKVKISISINFVVKSCQPPRILGDFPVDPWKFIDFTRLGILRLSSCTDKKWNSPLSKECLVNENPSCAHQEKHLLVVTTQRGQGLKLF